MTDDFDINLSEVEEDNDFSPMPAGNYEMVACRQKDMGIFYCARQRRAGNC